MSKNDIYFIMDKKLQKEHTKKDRSEIYNGTNDNRRIRKKIKSIEK